MSNDDYSKRLGRINTIRKLLQGATDKKLDEVKKLLTND